MGDNRREEAIDTVARRVLRHLTQNWFNGYPGPEHDDYPDLSDVQWSVVKFRLLDIGEARSSTSAEFEAAYEYLVRNP